MTVCIALITRKIDPRCTMLIVDIAWEIPVQLAIVTCNARIRRLGNNPLTSTIGILKQE